MSFLSDLAMGGVSGIISPITGMVTAIFNKKTDGKIEEGKQDVSVIQSRNTLLGQIHSDPAIALGWYVFIIPTGLWYIGIIAYCLIHPWFPGYKTVLALPDNLNYIPYAVVAFLFGLSWRGRT